MRENARSKSTEILFIDAIAGSGKTETAIKHMIEREQYGEKFILIQPTKLLIEKTAERIISSGYRGSLKTIISQDGAETVTKQIHDFLSYPGNDGILIVTFDGWSRIHRRKLPDWTLIVDECPTIFKITNLKAKSVVPKLLDHLEVTQLYDRSYYVVKVKEGSREGLNDLVKLAKSDKALALLLEPTRHILSRMRTYVSKLAWDSYMQGKVDAMTFYHVTTSGLFRGFKSVTIISANFQSCEYPKTSRNPFHMNPGHMRIDFSHKVMYYFRELEAGEH